MLDTSCAQWYFLPASSHSLIMAVILDSLWWPLRLYPDIGSTQAHVVQSLFLPWSFVDTEVWGPIGTIQHSGIHKCQEVWESSHSARQPLTSGICEPKDKYPFLPETHSIKFRQSVGFSQLQLEDWCFYWCPLLPHVLSCHLSLLSGVTFTFLNKPCLRELFPPGFASEDPEGKIITNSINQC